MNEQKTEEKQELKTEVTSIAQEEMKTGQKIHTPSPDELVARASSSLINNLRQIESLLSTKAVSRKGTKRAVIAGLNLPTGDSPVRLQTNNEKMLFALIQRVIADRFLITQYHITKEAKRMREIKDLQEAQKEVIEKMKADGKPEEEIKALEEKHKQSVIDLDNMLRGEETDLKEELSEDDLNKKEETDE